MKTPLDNLLEHWPELLGRRVLAPEKTNTGALDNLEGAYPSPRGRLVDLRAWVADAQNHPPKATRSRFGEHTAQAARGVADGSRIGDASPGRGTARWAAGFAVEHRLSFA